MWIGLREPVDAADLRGWIESQDVDALLGSLHQVPVRAGDVIYVPAGIPHSIGAGVLIAELQEPTDFSIVCEWRGYPIDPDDTHLGMGWDVALGAFDLRAHEPVTALPDEAREFFWADADPSPAGRFAIWIVTAGEGEIDGRPARAGDTLAVPAAVTDVQISGDLEILRCLGPPDAGQRSARPRGSPATVTAPAAPAVRDHGGPATTRGDARRAQDPWHMCQGS